jgi:PAS domain S-box-containing protein
LEIVHGPGLKNLIQGERPPTPVKHPFLNALIWLLALAVVVAVGGYLFLNYEQNQMRQQKENELKAVTELKVNEISNWRNERLADALYLTASGFFAAGLQEWMENKNELNYQIMINRLKAYTAIYPYSDAKVVDLQGSILFGLADNQYISPETLAQLNQAVQQQKPQLVDFHLDNQGQPHLDLIAPVILLTQESKTCIGAVIFGLDPQQYFYPLLASWPLPDRSAESLLVERQGDTVLFLNNLKYQSGSALHLTIPLTQMDVPAVLAVLGQQGVFQGKDYRGVEVISVIQPIPDTAWYMVTKIDKSEAFTAINYTSKLVIILIFVTLGVILIAGLVLYQRMKRRQTEVLARLETEKSALLKHFEHLVKYANDMIFLFDADYHLVEANERALEKYEFTRLDLKALNLPDLVAPEAQKQHAADLLVSLKNKAQLYESVHRTKNGRSFPVEISARTIMVDDREYLQWIVRDISERKVLEIELDEYQNKIEHLNKVLRAIRNVNQLISRVKIPAELLRLASRELVETRGFEGAWLALIDDKGAIQDFYESGWQGAPLNQIEAQNLLSWCECVRQSVQDGKLSVVREPLEGCRNCLLAYRCTNLAVLVEPLMYTGKTRGFMAVSLEKESLTEDDGHLLKEIAADLSFALNNLETEKQRRQLEQEARRYLDIASVMIMVLDASGCVKLANKKLLETLGYAENEIIGRDWFALAIPDAEPVKAVFRQIMAGQIEQVENYTNPVRTRDGSLRTVSWHNAVIADPGGNITGAISSGEDISERLKSEEALKQSEAQFHALYENMDQGVVYKSSRGEVTSLNPAAQRILGLTPDQIKEPGRIWQDLKTVHEDGSLFPIAEHPIEIALNSGQTVKNTIMGILPPGASDYRWIIVDAAPQFKAGESRPYRAFITFSDITSLKNSAEILRKKQEFLDNVIENTPNPIWISDAAGTALRTNQALRDLFGVTDQEIIGKYNVLLDSQVKAQGLRAIVASVFLEGKTVQFNIDWNTDSERTLDLNSHRHVILETTIAAIKDENGKVINAICLHKDITSQRQSELALQESEENFRNSLENSPLGIQILDNQGTTLFANRAFLDLYGFKDLEEYNAIPDKERLTPESYRIHLERQTKNNLGQFVTPNFDVVIKRKDGSLRYINITRKAVLWNGETQVQALCQDVTEQKMAEIALQASEAKYRSLVNHVELGIFRTEPGWNGRFIEINPAMEEITGYSREELLKLNVIDLYVDPQVHQELIRQITNSQGQFQKEARFKKKDQSQITVFIAGNPIRDEAGRVMFIDGILEDITERQKDEARRLEVETLKQSNKTKSELLANVSHELRTPLASIKGFIETMIEPDVRWSRNESLDFLNSANREVDRLNYLIKDLLDMSRIDSGKMTLDRQTVKFEEIIQSATPVLTAITKNHVLRLEIDQLLPEIQADKLRIAQVLTNLVENATKFSAPGSLITISARAEKGYLQVSVTDQGEGMTEMVLANLFNRFFQAERVVNGKTRGTGLGLAICKGIIESHGGQIWAESRVGNGSKFTFWLPTQADSQAGEFSLPDRTLFMA